MSDHLASLCLLLYHPYSLCHRCIHRNLFEVAMYSVVYVPDGLKEDGPSADVRVNGSRLPFISRYWIPHSRKAASRMNGGQKAKADVDVNR
jgi:hypothetical protein